ncbi:MAG: hypothetical protein EXR75_12630 [Myxococcales bacterium]|nr:hypothetical protein [Myxococcales bacterium]
MIFAALLGSAAISMACSTEESSSTNATSSSTTTSASGGAGGGATTASGGAGGAGGGCVKNTMKDCKLACEALYDCGVVEEAGMPLCKFTGTMDEKQLWMNGSKMDGCVATCEATPALKAIVNECDCGKTVNTLKSLNPKFKETCEGGIGSGSGGAGGSN